MPEELSILHQSIATGNGFELYKHYSEAQAAEFLSMHHVTLKKRRYAGDIDYLKLGERSIGYFGYQIADFLIRNNFKSGTSGLAEEKIVQLGMPVSMTRQPNAHAVSAFALKSFQ